MKYIYLTLIFVLLFGCSNSKTVSLESLRADNAELTQAYARVDKEKENLESLLVELNEQRAISLKYLLDLRDKDPDDKDIPAMIIVVLEIDVLIAHIENELEELAD